MKILIVGVIAFLIIVYLYTFIKYRKRKSNDIDTVGEFRKNYIKDTVSKKPDATSDYTRYLTKYNCTLDYIEKDEFLKEAAEPDAKLKKKKLQF